VTPKKTADIALKQQNTMGLYISIVEYDDNTSIKVCLCIATYGSVQWYRMRILFDLPMRMVRLSCNH